MEEIKSSLLAVLPDLDSALLNEVVDHLVKEVGVKVPEDFKFIEYDDLPMLKPIQRRKYLDNLKKEKTEHQPSTSAPRQDERQLTPTDTASPQGVCVFTNVSPNWAEDYEVPWTKLPKRDVLANLEKGLRPSPKARREMIRIIAADIANITLKPGKKSLTCIAQKIVKRYPKSFKDDIEGIVVGSGFDSLLKQLICRFENINRNSNAAQQKHKRDDDGNENSEAGLTGKENPPVRDSYECINYLPCTYSSGESEATQQEKKTLLQEKYLCSASEEVESLIKETYNLQRKELIVNETSIPILQREWPFLFQPSGMFTHFGMLTGIQIQQQTEENLAMNMKHIINWMKEEPNRKIRQTYEDLLEAKIILKNRSSEIPASVISHFKENEKSVYQLVEPTLTEVDVESQLQKTPCLVVVGETLLMADRYMLAIDGIIVNNSIPNFTVGLLIMFASYYIFGICYPKDADATLEFIQRCFVGINPDKGTKAEKKKNRAHHTPVHPKVLGLINTFADLQWRR